jgi:CubicO group peptidase (beta-lactamase class C family)
MKPLSLFLPILVLFFLSPAQASGLSALKECVRQGYAGLTNRHAIVAAVLDADTSQILTFGSAKEDQIFEIGSVTKTFTANLLAQSVGAGTLKLSDTIPAIYQKAGASITYQHLTTHTSGIIAGIFPDFQVTHPLSPYDGLTVPIFKTLYAGTPLATPPGAVSSYSNIGVSLLGLIMAENAGSTYEEQVRSKIFKVLGLNNTYFDIPESDRSRFPHGYMIDADGKTQDMPHWDLYQTAIDPAGGIRSTIGDMVKYANANLAPSKSPLANSIQISQQKILRIRNPNVWIGMNWMIEPDDGLIWHNGQTYGFNSILAISTKRHQSVVAMTDTTVMVKDTAGKTGFDTGLQDVAFRCLK